MNKIEEIKKLKQLLDDGIINNEEFTWQKQKILGLNAEDNNKNDYEKTNSLDDYESKLLKQLNEESNEEASSVKEPLDEKDFYNREKIKEKAKLEAQEEMKEQRNKKIKEDINAGKEKILIIIKWVLAVFCWLGALGGFANGIKYLPYGIVFFLLGIMSCPSITKYTTKYKMYTNFKKWIVIGLVILLFLLVPKA